MTRSEAEVEMMRGFIDGYDSDAPEPSANRSHSYRHGFFVGRLDKDTSPSRPLITAQELRERAEECIGRDAAN